MVKWQRKFTLIEVVAETEKLQDEDIDYVDLTGLLPEVDTQTDEEELRDKETQNDNQFTDVHKEVELHFGNEVQKEILNTNPVTISWKRKSN